VFRRSKLAAAIAALRSELAGGPRAELEGETRELADLLAARERARAAREKRDPPEQELLWAIPEAAALVSKQGWVRVSNSAFDALAASGRATGLTALEITRSAVLSEAVRRALEGTARRLEVAIGPRAYQVYAAPLLRGEVLLLLRDVTDAKRAESTRRDFVANASHELRTPITAIRAAAETLLAGAMDDPASARTFVEIVARHAERLSRLTKDLLDLSRIESGEWRLEVAPVEAGPVARGALELVSARAEEKGLALSADVPDEARVRADPRALEQVLVILLENAVKYTARGSVAVGAAREPRAWVLSVRDTGPGIDPHHLPRIFERFYRVDVGRSREQGGTGLGLAIAKHLVQAMGGEIGVESDAGGSRFHVRLGEA
jgi:two-component system phosphate regulon sensor histidine kinase PhoR